MLNFFRRFIDYNQRTINDYRKIVDQINALDDKAKALKDKDFAQETDRLKQLIKDNKETLDTILPWSFALVREAASRVLGQRHYDVQLIAGIALHNGKIAEQKTGEGKTLSATTAMYLNALTGRGVHLVTVNDYLARRDAGWMGAVFHLLGMTTSAIISDKSYIYDATYNEAESYDWRLSHLRQVSRRQAYDADITYGINSEFGFDYLRDNMSTATEQLVQRGFHFAIIDEADSVLIDEARTPHIISAPFDEDTSKYYQYAQVVKQLDSKTDFVIDEKLRTVNLNEQGIQKVEKILGVANIYEKDFDTLFHIEAALKAETLFKKDKDYIVRDNEVIIVDEFTGRLLQGRRFSEGLHQAIEAKEKVAIQKESKTLATVSLQNYFRMYEKLAGMTGTAHTEAEEFHKIYKTDVLVIPTNRELVRKDEPDAIYKTEQAKFNAVVEEIAANYKLGRPILVGTTSIEKNEYLSQLLKKKGVPHELLNAKNHEREAQIIARAGEKGSVTVATNMAGRGVDILLGGEPPSESQSSKVKTKKLMEDWKKKHEEVVQLGGLYVIGTERHESRRIDNQLRGRSGRQGDPGTTRFFVALDDDLMRIFGGEQISKLMTFLNFPEDQPLSHPMVSKAIEQAQVKVEGFNFDIRKHLVDYDDVLNKQREIVYSLRRKMLTLPEKDQTAFRQTVFDIFREEITTMILNYEAIKDSLTPEDVNNFGKELETIMHGLQAQVDQQIKKRNFDGLNDFIISKVEKEFREREKKHQLLVWFNVVRMIFLSTVDQYWTEHLTAIDDLRQGINLRGYAQLDPLVEYKNEAYRMFEKLIGSINYDFSRRIFHVQIEALGEQSTNEEGKPLVFQSATAIDPFTTQQKRVEESPLPVEATSQDRDYNESLGGEQGIKIIPPGTSHQKIGRNDPCWCGSGKKWKKCHYPQLP